MNDSVYWRGIALLFVVGVLYVGHGLNSQTPLPSLTPAAYGSVGVATEDAETLFTASEDGRRIYMWQYYRSRSPNYMGQAEAVLNQ